MTRPAPQTPCLGRTDRPMESTPLLKFMVQHPPVSPRSLDRAIAHAEFLFHEGILIGLLREQCGSDWDTESDELWDEQIDQIPLRLDLTDLARQTGIVRSKFRRALDRLIAAQVVRPQADGTLRLNGDIAAWVNPTTGKQRLNRQRLAFCRDDRWLGEMHP